MAGYGAAGKAQVQAMVARLLGLPEVPKPPDAADALALALCHLSAGRFRAAAGAGGAMTTFDGSSPPPAPGLARAIAAAMNKGSSMIGSLRGTILDRSIGGEVLVEVGGVGYRVAVPSGAWPPWSRAARPSSTPTWSCGRTRSASTASPTGTSATRSRR